MKIYFGAQPLANLYDTDGMFACDDAPEHLFYYGVEFGSNCGGLDEVMIFDGCDRNLPVDIESIPSLMTALSRIYSLHRAFTIADVLKEDAYAATELSVL